MIWFYAMFLFPVVCTVINQIPALVGLAILVAFYWIEVTPQIKFVKARFDDQYPRKAWPKPVGIAVVSIVVGVLLVGMAMSIIAPDVGTNGQRPYVPPVTNLPAADPKVELVKNGHLSVYPNIAIGKAVSGFMGNPRWESGTGQDGTEFVNVRGSIRYMEKEVEALLQFQVTDRMAGAFEARALEFNGVPQNRVIQIALIQKMYEGSTSAVGTTTATQSPTNTGHEDTHTGTTKPDSGYSQVAVGMTRAQVDTILGPGKVAYTQEQVDNTFIQVDYEMRNHRIAITYKNGLVSMKERVAK